MSDIMKYKDQKQEMDYFRGLAMIASKGSAYNASPEALLNIMLTAKDLGISPMKAINGGFYVVNGKISMSTALMADRIRKEGHSIKIPEWTSKKCVIIGVRKDNSDSIKFEYTWEDAVAAGLVNSPTWKKFPKQMLYNRAMATLARTLFPDVVGNAYSEDEKFDIANIPPEKRPDYDPDMEIAFSPEKKEEVEDFEDKPDISPLEQLKDCVEADGMDSDRLDEYIDHLARKKGKETGKILEAALLPQLLPRFMQSYADYCAAEIAS